MNSSMLRRLFKTISAGDLEAVQKIAWAVVEEESKKGHTQVSKELAEILSKNREPLKSPVVPLSRLPKSTRTQIPLATTIPFEELRYQMILPAAVEEEFTRIEREYAAKERLALHGLTPSRKILLYGSPGCGKSMGAERLSWNTGLPLIKVRFDAIVSSYLGETAINLRSIFDTIHQTPCLFFIDEADSLARTRLAAQEVGEVKRVVNTFLQLLDEYRAPGLLVAATNLDADLDPAVWRRFDAVIEVPRPGRPEIRRIIEQSLGAISHQFNHWEGIADGFNGMSAAQVVTCAQRAAKRLVLDGGSMLTENDLMNEVDKVRRDK